MCIFANNHVSLCCVTCHIPLRWTFPSSAFQWSILTMGLNFQPLVKSSETHFKGTTNNFTHDLSCFKSFQLLKEAALSIHPRHFSGPVSNHSRAFSTFNIRLLLEPAHHLHAFLRFGAAVFLPGSCILQEGCWHILMEIYPVSALYSYGSVELWPTPCEKFS